MLIGYLSVMKIEKSRKMFCRLFRFIRKGLVFVLLFFSAFYFFRIENMFSVEEPQEENEILPCKIPNLNIYANEIMRFIKPSKPIVCPGIDFVEINGNYAFISEKAVQEFGSMNCTVKDIIRKDDFINDLSNATNLTGRYNLLRSDFIRVECICASSMYHNVMAGIRTDEKVLRQAGWDKVSEKSLRLNVLMFGFDSMSRLMFERKLPQSLAYLRNSLGSIEMKGYNIVGDGTPQALIPMLTGKTEKELPETRNRFAKYAHFVNVYPFVWKDFERQGYVTGYGEDMPQYGTFTYRLRGFNEAPTFHYLRPFFIEANKLYRDKHPFCLGSTPTHKVMMKYVLDFFRVYENKPKFIFAFHSELSHRTINGVGSVDSDMLEWLETLLSEGHLEQTLLIIMSDHGPRFSALRNTQQGKLEERLPMFSFVFPKWFKSSYPSIISNLESNAKKLTTPFDIHATLMDVLNYVNTSVGNQSDRSISLFRSVPTNRTCTDAGIEPHWCSCMRWHNVSVFDKMVIEAAQFVTKKMSAMSDSLRHKCKELSLDKILEAVVLVPLTNMLKFVHSADWDGFVPNLSGKATVTQNIYQIKLLIQPGNALYEVSVTYSFKYKQFYAEDSNISRINKYSPFTRCLNKSELYLRKFCYCRE